MAKSPDAFRSIGEVARLVGVAPHVLRYWEQQFAQLAPVKRADGRRYYRPEDVCLAAGLSQVLREDGLSIRGARRLIAADRGAGLRQIGAARLARAGASGDLSGAPSADLPADLHEDDGARPPSPPPAGAPPGAIRLAVPAPAPAAQGVAPFPASPGPARPGGEASSGGEANVGGEGAQPHAGIAGGAPKAGPGAHAARPSPPSPGRADAEADPWLLRLIAMARALELAAPDPDARLAAGPISARLRGLLARRRG